MAVKFQCVNHNTLPVKARNGGLFCFNCVVETHQAQVYNLAFQILGERGLAEDATQETFISAYRSFHQFHGENVRAWLLSIASNRCRDMLRSAKARPSASLEQELEANPAANPPSQSESPEESVLRGELGALLQRAVQGLPEGQKLVVVLIDVQGLSYEEAAQVVGCSLGTVKSRLSRARASLRDELIKHGELLPQEFRQE